MNLLTLLGLTLFAFNSFSDTCYLIDKPNAGIPPSNDQETWCHREFSIENNAFQMIYNADSGVRPHLSFLINKSSLEASYAFLNKGRLTLAKSKIDDFNPIPPHVANLLDSANTLQQITPEKPVNAKALAKIEKVLLNKMAEKSSIRNRSTVSAGRFEAYLDKSKHPFNGYWWPSRKMQMARGKAAPMPIYDSLVQSFLGMANPASTAWELKNHDAQIRWGGHCNGWAAASILAEEPKYFLKDPQSGTEVSPAVQKAWLTETHYCVNLSFYGKRYRHSGDNKADMNPASFHKLLIQYLQNQKKPIVLDIQPLTKVDNQVVTGYSMRIRKSRGGKFKVRTKLQMHGYSSRASNKLGAAKTYSKTYKYVLDTDDSGRIISGKWSSSKNPDFLWVPLAQSNCGNENPNISAKLVNKLIRTLPKR